MNQAMEASNLNTEVSDWRLPRAVRRLLHAYVVSAQKNIAIDCWGHDTIPPNSPHQATVLHFRHPGVVRDLIVKRDPLALVEHWLDGFAEFDGELEDILGLLESDTTGAISPFLKAVAWSEAHALPPIDSTISSANLSTKASIQYHYDVSNDFYRLWLDPEMVYSCAYFADPNISLAQAQQLKLNLICKKLLLNPRDHLLDIGCGWGGLLIHAAKNFGIKATGITLSQEQFEYARERIREEHLESQVNVELADYREFSRNNKYSKIASVGMIEHVGEKNYPEYYELVRDLLAPGGLYLNHGIVTMEEFDHSGFRERFIRTYIFPNGELASLPEMLRHMKDQGLEIVDVDSWRPHYALTLRHWAEALENHWAQAVQTVGERTAKLWQMYMRASSNGFHTNYLGIYQTLARHHSDKEWNLPMQRAFWLCI